MMAAMNLERTSGVVLVNPTGLVRHKGISPEWMLNTLANLGKISWLRGGYEAFLYQGR